MKFQLVLHTQIAVYLWFRDELRMNRNSFLKKNNKKTKKQKQKKKSQATSSLLLRERITLTQTQADQSICCPPPSPPPPPPWRRVRPFATHHENMPMWFWTLKTPLLYIKTGVTGVYIIFLFLLKNIYCGLEPPRRGGSNEYPVYVLSRFMKNIRIFHLKIFIFW